MHALQALIQRIEILIHGVKLMVNGVKPPINGVEPRDQVGQPGMQSVQQKGITATMVRWSLLPLLLLLLLLFKLWLPRVPVQWPVPQVPLMVAFRLVLLVRTRENTVVTSDMDDEAHNVGGKVHTLAHISFARGKLMQDKIHDVKLLTQHDMLNDVPCVTPDGIIIATPRQDSGTDDPVDDTR